MRLLWGLLKKKISLKKPQIIMKLRALIIQACNGITKDMCHRAINNITARVEEVARHNTDHTEHLIHTG
jgi:hypothetical protein